MELTNQGVELVAVDRGYLESLVLGKAHAEGQLAQAEHTVVWLKRDLEQTATELSEARVRIDTLLSENTALLSTRMATLNAVPSDFVGGGTTPVQTQVTPAMPTAFDTILVRLEPNAARTALGYLAGMNGGPLPDDHALRPVYDRLKQALMGQRAGS